MANRCEYCGLYLKSDDKVCPNCGAPVPAVSPAPAEREPESYRRGIPRTIEELQAFCRAKNMPLGQMRFFIGQDYPAPRAFGIYRDADGDFVVYKNKSDGTRTIRYKGPNEDLAVREIYRKLQDEITQRRGSGRSVSPSAGSRGLSSDGSRPRGAIGGLRDLLLGSNLSRILTTALLVVMGVVILFFSQRFGKTLKEGYYRFDDVYYYCQNEDWYYFSPSMLEWAYAGSVDDELLNNPGRYYESPGYDESFEISSFRSSPFYTGGGYSDGFDDGDDWGADDDNWDYDFDTWDSGDTDWDSDW